MLKKKTRILKKRLEASLDRAARFYKDGERRKREELAVKQVHHNVEMDFSQYFKTELDKETFLFSSFVCSDLK